jgi:hypothetical protein
MAVTDEATEPRLGLWSDLVDELRWTFAGRKGWLIGLGVNVATAAAYVGYSAYDPNKPDDIRIANVGVLLAAWILTNVLSTNQLGSDKDRVGASLDDGDSVARILAIKNLALCVLLVPLAIAASFAARIMVDRWRLLPQAVIFDIGIVFLWMGVGSVASVLVPYDPIGLRDRFKARPTWLRWVACLALPYFCFYLVVPLLSLPYAIIYFERAFGSYQPRFLLYCSTFLVMALVYWCLGLWVASRYARRWGSRLRSDLRRSG